MTFAKKDLLGEARDVRDDPKPVVERKYCNDFIKSNLNLDPNSLRIFHVKCVALLLGLETFRSQKERGVPNPSP